ncbi:pentapeptide repeat-containing protein [Sorangium sp. So ce1153]|uniref:pentapeptide repeat-containing protein n=1 Tax=Sorangium sp. So ce1153 TaxID=3133333 RepID=UPI003F5FBCFB
MDRHHFDALIVTALLDELEAVLAHGGAWLEAKDADGYRYHIREFEMEDGTGFRIAAATFDKMGEAAAAARAASLIKELDPACLAMCGICAGNKADVSLGDVIVADRIYSYDHGKLVAKRKGGRRIETVYRDIETYNLKQQWRVDAAYFAKDLAWVGALVVERPPQPEGQDRWLLRAVYEHEIGHGPAPTKHPERMSRCPNWSTRIKTLRQKKLLERRPGPLALTKKGRNLVLDEEVMFPDGVQENAFKIIVGPIATGKKVAKDPQLFDNLALFVRKTVGVEMEGAAIGMVGELLDRPTVVVKAVSDYGDGDKDDSFRKFAARASAEVLIRFLLRYVKPVEDEADDARYDSRRRPDDRLLLRGTSGDDLLSRVQQITELRVRQADASAEISRFRARTPFSGYLRVSAVQHGRFTRVYPVAAVDQVNADVLDRFLADIDSRYRCDDPGVFSTLVYGGAPPPHEVAAKAATKGILLQSFLEYQGLIDFRDYLNWQIDRLAKDTIYPPELYVEQHASIRWDGGAVDTDDALAELSRLLTSPLGRFVLVLGDFGTGKTFLLRELARRMALAGGPLVPVLIEMRALIKAPKLDPLLAQSLSLAGVERFDLRAFRYMLAQGRIALLFDGFDELALRVSYERAAEHFETLSEAAQGAAKIVLTSRTQHFFSDDQATGALELGRQARNISGYRLIKLHRFNRDQISHFLEKRLGGANEAGRRLRLLDDVRDLLGLSEYPRMLAFIAEIPEQELLDAKARSTTITSAGLYELLLNRWIIGEFERAHPKGAPPGLDVAQRWRAVTDVAMRLWVRTERCINMSELPDEILDAVRALSVTDLDPGVVKHQIGSGTLLVRDEESNFSFIHHSVMEWLVAKFIAGELAEAGTATALAVREISPLMADFIWALAGRDKAEAWAQRTIQEYVPAVVYKNALRMLERLHVEARGLKLSGQDLTGQSLAGQNLRYADLRGAKLSGASLAGQDMTGAKFERAQLQRADLSGAHLQGADLREANMSYAQLSGANLKEARLTGANLRQAKLIGATIDPNGLDACDVFGAALPDQRDLYPMISASSFCYSVAYSSDGRYLATGHGGSIRLWDVDSWTELRVLAGSQGVVSSLAFSGDGRTLASSGADGTIHLWDLSSGTIRHTLRGHLGAVRGVAFAPDGTMLASASLDTTVCLWDVIQGSRRAVLQGHTKGVSSVAFTPDGATLASGAADATVRLWDLHSGRSRTLNLYSQIVRSIAFNNNGTVLASGSWDGQVHLWDVTSGTVKQVLNSPARGLHCIAFSPNGAWLARGFDDTTVHLWNVGSSSESHVLRGHRHAVYAVAFSPDSSLLVSGSHDTTVRLWDVKAGALRHILSRKAKLPWSVTFLPDGATLALGSWDATIRLWDVASGTESRVFKGHQDQVWSVASASNGEMLASGASDNTVRLWDIASGIERHILRGHEERVVSTVFSRNGTMLASGASDGTVRLWDTASGANRGVLKGHKRWGAWSIAFSHDGKLLATVPGEDSIYIWNVASGIKRKNIKFNNGRVSGVAFVTNDTLLVTSKNGTVGLWGARSGVAQRAFEVSVEIDHGFDIAVDGRLLAIPCDDTTVRLWDIASGTEYGVLKGHAENPIEVAFSPGGTLLASTSSDGTARVWHVATRRCLAVLCSLPEGWVGFTPDGRFRSGGSLNGAFWYSIGLCRFEPDELDPYLDRPLRLSDTEPLFEIPAGFR